MFQRLTGARTKAKPGKRTPRHQGREPPPDYSFESDSDGHSNSNGSGRNKGDSDSGRRDVSHKLPLSDVRSIATSAGYHEINYDDTNHVISFLPRGEPQELQDEQLVRINVYYITGTVATCRIMDGEVRQIFHRKCSLRKLGRILRHPPQLTLMNGEDKRLIDVINKEESGDESNAGRDFRQDDIGNQDRVRRRRVPQDELVMQLRKKIEVADLGLAILVSERDTLAKDAASMQTEKSKDEPRRVEEEAGRNFSFCVNGGIESDVERCLDVDDAITCIATNGEGVIVLYGSCGDWAYTSGIPNKLRNKLNGRQRTLPSPNYVSIGTEDRYYISFADGSDQWYGPKKLDKCLKATTKKVKTISFGDVWDSFFIVFEDGSWEHKGGIPGELGDVLDDRGGRGDLTCVSIGPNMEFFVKARNGKSWWGGGLSQDLRDELESIDGDISFIDFGIHGTYFVRYTD